MQYDHKHTMFFPFPFWLNMAAGLSMAPRLVLKPETTVAPPLRENREWQ